MNWQEIGPQKPYEDKEHQPFSMVEISPSWICSSFLQSELQKELGIPLVQKGCDEFAVVWVIKGNIIWDILDQIGTYIY